MQSGAGPKYKRPVCRGPIAYEHREPLRRDLAAVIRRVERHSRRIKRLASHPLHVATAFRAPLVTRARLARSRHALRTAHLLERLHELRVRHAERLQQLARGHAAVGQQIDDHHGHRPHGGGRAPMDEVERAMLEQRILQLKIEHRDLDDVIKRLAEQYGLPM